MPAQSDDHSEYSSVTPTRTSGLTAYPEWLSKLPIEQPGLSGTAGLYDDDRIKILIRMCPVQDYNVIELGPFEAGHTYMLHNAGASSIDAIEAHRSSYIKCLLSKEAFSLVRANFYLGDFVSWLQQNSKVYDLAIASGVLYHMSDPVQLLDLLCSRAKRIFLWTHYAPSEPYADGDLLREAYTGVIDTVNYNGIELKLYQRTYLDVAATSTFCGGVRDRHAWMEKEGILSVLRSNGFTEQHIYMDQPSGHPNGPCFCVYAKKEL